MSQFVKGERLNQVQFKARSGSISEAARADGIYRDHEYPFCLPVHLAEENLFPGIRDWVQDFFARHQIKWHNGFNRNPSNHMCSSQVCCVNFLAPFADNPEALKVLFLPFFPNIQRMLPVEDGKYVSFEWIGADNYLCELISRNGKRSRGALFTSADAIMMFERKDQQRQAVLIEWKYTESYGSKDLRIADSGRDRTSIYRHLFDADDCPIDKEVLPSFNALFFEPFYQLMRQQFLANKMEKAHELGCDVVSTLHIAPAHNLKFTKVTSDELLGLGDSATGVWKTLVKDKSRFTNVSTEELFGGFLLEEHAGMDAWGEYVMQRYGGILH
jgi:hypothetical protein